MQVNGSTTELSIGFTKAQQHPSCFGRCFQHQMPPPIAKVDSNPKMDLSLCKEAWVHLRGYLLSLLLSELKSRGLAPVSTLSLCRDLAAIVTTLVAKVMAGLGTGPSVLQVLLKFPAFAITNSTPTLEKKICYHWAYATAKHPIQYNFSLFWELHCTVSLYSICLSDIAH